MFHRTWCAAWLSGALAWSDPLAGVLVFGAAGLAAPLSGVGQSLATPAHPAHAPRRHADHQRVILDVMRDDGAGADERILTERDAADDRRVCADAGSTPHACCAVFVLSRDVAPRIDDVGEHHRRSAEHVVLQLDALIHTHVVLDLAISSDARAVHHDDILSKTTMLADHSAGHYMAKMPDLRPRSDRRAGIDVRRLVDECLLGSGHSTATLALI